MPAPYYSVVIPVYNEVERLPVNFGPLYAYVQRLPESAELIFVDDGSTDETASLLETYRQKSPFTLVRLPQNLGKGGAVRAGMLQAKGKMRAFLDVDLATPPQELDKLFKALAAGADVAIGSRITEYGVDLRVAGQKPQSPLRRVLGKLFRLVATKPFLGNIRDSQCGAKAFTGAAAEKLFPRQRVFRWSFDIELLYMAKQSDMKIVEIPVEWSAVENSKLRPSLAMAIDVLRELISIAWLHRKGL